MQYFVIRHGMTDANRLTRAAYGKRGAPLNKQGIKQAEKLRTLLKEKGIDIDAEPAAVSEFLRAEQTAEIAGIKKIVVYNVLNEIQSDPVKTQELIKKGVVPGEAVNAAKKLLKNPPKEKVWVTHGLLIAALLNIIQETKGVIVPDFCEITEINI